MGNLGSGDHLANWLAVEIGTRSQARIVSRKLDKTCTATVRIEALIVQRKPGQPRAILALVPGSIQGQTNGQLFRQEKSPLLLSIAEFVDKQLAQQGQFVFSITKQRFCGLLSIIPGRACIREAAARYGIFAVVGG